MAGVGRAARRADRRRGDRPAGARRPLDRRAGRRRDGGAASRARGLARADRADREPPRTDARQADRAVPAGRRGAEPQGLRAGRRVVRRGGAALVRPQPAAHARAPHRARAARDRRADARGARRARPHRAPVLGRGGGGAACPTGATPRCPDAATRRWCSPADAWATSSPGTPAASRPAGRWLQPEEPLKSEQMNTLSALGWWALDYAYAGWRQLAVLGARRLPSALAHRRCGQARDRAPAGRVRALVVPAAARRRPQRRGPSRGDRARPAPEPAADRRDVGSRSRAPSPACRRGRRDASSSPTARAGSSASTCCCATRRRPCGSADSWRSARRSRVPGAPGSSPTRASGPCCRATRRS